MWYNSNMGTIEREVILMLREELDWMYSKMNKSESRLFESSINNIIKTMLGGIVETVVKKQLVKESQQFREMVELFRMSKN